MSKGISVEFEFINYFNNKRVYELDPMASDFLKSIYKDNFIDNYEIQIYKALAYEKTDLIMNINGSKRYISIKSGDKNSVHTESVKKFCLFLKKNGLAEARIEKFLLYHYGDGTINGSGHNRLSVQDFKKDNHLLINDLNCNLKKVISPNIAVDKFLLNGNSSFLNREVDVIIYGVPFDFLWATKDEIIRLVKYMIDRECSGLHFSIFNIQPMTRCLNYNVKYESYRHVVQIKWFNMFDHLILILLCRENGTFELPS